MTKLVGESSTYNFLFNRSLSNEFEQLVQYEQQQFHQQCHGFIESIQRLSVFQ